MTLKNPSHEEIAARVTALDIAFSALMEVLGHHNAGLALDLDRMLTSIKKTAPDHFSSEMSQEIVKNMGRWSSFLNKRVSLLEHILRTDNHDR